MQNSCVLHNTKNLTNLIFTWATTGNQKYVNILEISGNFECQLEFAENYSGELPELPKAIILKKYRSVVHEQNRQSKDTVALFIVNKREYCKSFSARNYFSVNIEEIEVKLTRKSDFNWSADTESSIQS